jgi:hypothetical protein
VSALGAFQAARGVRFQEEKNMTYQTYVVSQQMLVTVRREIVAANAWDATLAAQKLFMVDDEPGLHGIDLDEAIEDHLGMSVDVDVVTSPIEVAEKRTGDG